MLQIDEYGKCDDKKDFGGLAALCTTMLQQ